MAPLRWIASLLLAGSLVSGTPYTADATTPFTTRGNVDIASQFIAELIANATRAEQQQVQHTKKRRSCGQNNPLVVDLEYAKYRGYYNATTGLNYWKGIRFAAPPTGKLRWQPPQALPPKRDAPITNATAFGPICPQALPSSPNGQPFTPGNEDCLFLNVYAPPRAEKLPVLVWIHGGGYGLGDGTQDMTDFINANNKGFVAVTIQYRLGAFGWMSSSELKERGAVNAGILDQAFALAWVKEYVTKFGGDPQRVTISGESAGGGSVMYHDIALKGNLGNLLFTQSIAASPYLPFQYHYNDAVPTSRYYAFSKAVGCPSSGDVLDCIVSKDSDTLQRASLNVTQLAASGYWGFWPVTDDSYIMNRPSQQLPTKKVNGKKLLVGHNANEGPLFVPHDITTEADLVAWLSSGEFPDLTPAQINTILAANPNSALTSASGPHFATDGVGNATAVQVAQDANGQQQRANNIYAEAVFVCPAYWLASAFSSPSASSFLYQYSIPYAFHGSDVAGYFGPQLPTQSDDFVRAFRRIWGNFVVRGDPSITEAEADGTAAVAVAATPNPAANWPRWTDEGLQFVNLNETGGTPYQSQLMWGANVTLFREPGLKNAFSLASGKTWEGGRKARCDVYLSLGASIPL